MLPGLSIPFPKNSFCGVDDCRPIVCNGQSTRDRQAVCLEEFFRPSRRERPTKNSSILSTRENLIVVRPETESCESAVLNSPQVMRVFRSQTFDVQLCNAVQIFFDRTTGRLPTSHRRLRRLNADARDISGFCVLHANRRHGLIRFDRDRFAAVKLDRDDDSQCQNQATKCSGCRPFPLSRSRVASTEPSQSAGHFPLKPKDLGFPFG